ncbi:spermatogenesis-associated protein 48 isoform X2 [Silurus meridionalis]|uniref:spermatogenesis-associated protein 48 isoform X2 n=1 Tax=Silurus meridionalis TaxID=175797 RepID=UPI001EEAFA3F|nr:spermatogenesis-associated protein 48 isoform X2 [Silurus meridionalis]
MQQTTRCCISDIRAVVSLCQILRETHGKSNRFCRMGLQNRVETCRMLCRHMNVPYESGRHDTRRDSGAFQPQFCPPRAPLREDEPLTVSYSGRLSAAARADLSLKAGDAFTRRVCFAPDFRPHTPSPRTSAVTTVTSDHKPWDSKVKKILPPNPQNIHSSREKHDPVSTRLLEFKDLKRVACTSPPPESMDKVLRNNYTSETRRSFKAPDWDSNLSPGLKPPLSTLEKMADPVSQHFTLKRYHSRPELWQTVGPQWNKHQIRASYNVKKPFSFTSPCTKSGQIPLYSGVIGSENMDNIDIPEKDFIPLTLLRTVIPPDTPTAQYPSHYSWLHWKNSAQQTTHLSHQPTYFNAYSSGYRVQFSIIMLWSEGPSVQNGPHCPTTQSLPST